jgi:hypothetical protein
MDEIDRIYNLWKKTPTPRDGGPPMLNERRIGRSLRGRDRLRPRIVNGPQNGDSDCFHCRRLFFMHQSRGGRFGLCQICLDN